MNASTTSAPELPEKARKYLKEFYKKIDAADASDSEKIHLLKRKLGGDVHIYACGGEVTEEMMLNNLEHELLCEEGVLKRSLF